MLKVESVVTGLDRYPSTPSLTWNGLKKKQNIIGGIIGLIFFTLTLILIFSKSITVFSKNDILLDSFTKKDISKIEVEGMEVILTLLVIQDGAVFSVPYRLLRGFGILPVIIEVELDYRVEGEEKINIDLIPMEACGYEQFYCAPDLLLQPECSYDSIDFEVCNYVKEYHVVFMNITAKPNLSPGFYPMLLLFDNKYNLFEKNPDDIIKQVPIALNKLPGGAGLQIDKRYLFEVPITKLELSVDSSIMPSSIPLFGGQNYTEEYYYPMDKLRISSDNGSFFEAIAPELQTYFDFYIYRSGFTETYKRSYYRFDSMLGEVFGLLGLLTLGFSFCCAGYNQWLMDLHVKESLNATNLRRERHFGAYLKDQMNKLSKS